MAGAFGALTGIPSAVASGVMCGYLNGRERLMVEELFPDIAAVGGHLAHLAWLVDLAFQRWCACATAERLASIPEDRFWSPRRLLSSKRSFGAWPIDGCMRDADQLPTEAVRSSDEARADQRPTAPLLSLGEDDDERSTKGQRSLDEDRDERPTLDEDAADEHPTEARLSLDEDGAHEHPTEARLSLEDGANFGAGSAGLAPEADASRGMGVGAGSWGLVGRLLVRRVRRTECGYGRPLSLLLSTRVSRDGNVRADARVDGEDGHSFPRALAVSSRLWAAGAFSLGRRWTEVAILFVEHFSAGAPMWDVRRGRCAPVWPRGALRNERQSRFWVAASPTGAPVRALEHRCTLGRCRPAIIRGGPGARTGFDGIRGSASAVGQL